MRIGIFGNICLTLSADVVPVAWKCTGRVSVYTTVPLELFSQAGRIPLMCVERLLKNMRFVRGHVLEVPRIQYTCTVHRVSLTATASAPIMQ